MSSNNQYAPDASGWYSGGNSYGYDENAQSSGYTQGYGIGDTGDQGGWGGYDQTPSGYGSGGQYNNNQQQFGGSMFIPNEIPPTSQQNSSDVNFEDEPPLLEELGINFEHIKLKTVAVLNPLKDASAEVIADQDLAGPLVFCLLFGGALLLHGKVSFGYIYGIGVLGCVGMYWLLNLMSNVNISLTCTVSVLGYCLLPMALLSLLGVVVNFRGYLGLIVSCLAVLWCSVTSSKLFVTALSMQHQRFLVAYPCLLLYGMFALLAVF